MRLASTMRIKTSTNTQRTLTLLFVARFRSFFLSLWISQFCFLLSLSLSRSLSSLSLSPLSVHLCPLCLCPLSLSLSLSPSVCLHISVSLYDSRCSLCLQLTSSAVWRIWSIQICFPCLPTLQPECFFSPQLDCVICLDFLHVNRCSFCAQCQSMQQETWNSNWELKFCSLRVLHVGFLCLI